MSPLGTVWLVARREVVTRAGSKALRIGTALMLLALVGTIVAIDLIGGGSSARDVGLLQRDAALAAPLRATGEDVDVSTVRDAAAGERAVRDGDLDAFVASADGRLDVMVKERLPDGLRTALDAVARQQALDGYVSSLGGSSAAAQRAMAAAGVDVRALEPEQEFEDQRLVAGIVVGILVYISLLSYGQIVAQGVVEEKASRVVELLLSTIRAWQLMAGKVLGIGLVGLAQIALLLAAGAIAGIATGQLTLPTSVAVGTVAWGVGWYLLGFFLYALLFAAAGALVSRQEDVGGVSMPLMMAIIIPYVFGISVLPSDPDNEAAAVLSVIPVCSPTIMPMRIAMGAATTAEIVLSVVLTIGLIAVLVRLTGRVYANAVMRIGARIPLRDALRAA